MRRAAWRKRQQPDGQHGKKPMEEPDAKRRHIEKENLTD